MISILFLYAFNKNFKLMCNYGIIFLIKWQKNKFMFAKIDTDRGRFINILKNIFEPRALLFFPFNLFAYLPIFIFGFDIYGQEFITRFSFIFVPILIYFLSSLTFFSCIGESDRYLTSSYWFLFPVFLIMNINNIEAKNLIPIILLMFLSLIYSYLVKDLLFGKFDINKLTQSNIELDYAYESFCKKVSSSEKIKFYCVPFREGSYLACKYKRISTTDTIDNFSSRFLKSYFASYPFLNSKIINTKKFSHILINKDFLSKWLKFNQIKNINELKHLKLEKIVESDSHLIYKLN
tara:strand:- start:62 stop:940 length:879 start_codon:yes stop_codon:yes gene_type:complete